MLKRARVRAAIRADTLEPHGPPPVVVFADEVIAERLVRFGLDADEEFPGASGAEDDEVGIPVFATKTVKWDDALRIGVGQDEVTLGK